MLKRAFAGPSTRADLRRAERAMGYRLNQLLDGVSATAWRRFSGSMTLG